VSRAVGLLYQSIAMSVLGFFVGGPAFAEVSVFNLFLVFMFTWLISLWLVTKVDKGCNWARIIYLILFLFGIPFYIRSILHIFSHSLISDILSLTRMIFEMIALIMLFTPNARPWFRSTAAVLPKVRDNPTDVRSNP
jgi:hypothetical protein